MVFTVIALFSTRRASFAGTKFGGGESEGGQKFKADKNR